MYLKSVQRKPRFANKRWKMSDLTINRFFLKYTVINTSNLFNITTIILYISFLAFIINKFHLNMFNRRKKSLEYTTIYFRYRLYIVIGSCVVFFLLGLPMCTEGTINEKV